MAVLQLSADHAVQVSALGEMLTVSNTGGGNVYFSSRQDVSAGQHDGVLTVGQAVSSTYELWVRAGSYTSITVAYTPLTPPAGTSVQAFNAVGDGVTDDAGAFAVALAAGGDVFVPPAPGGKYRVSSLNLTTSVRLRGAGKLASIIEVDDIAGNGITAQGTQSTGYAVTTDVLLGASTIIVADVDAGSLGFSAGDMLFLRNPAGQAGGSFVTRVLSVARVTPDGSHATITVEDEIPIIATVAEGSLVYRQVPITFVLEDLTVQMTPAVSPLQTYMLAVLYHENSAIRRCRFRYMGSNPAMGTSSMIHSRAGRAIIVSENETFGQIGAGQNTSAAAFNWDFTNTTGVGLTGNYSRRCCHGASLSGCPQSTVQGNRFNGRSDGGGRGVKLLNQSNYSVISGNVLRGFDAVPSGSTSPAWTGVHCEDSSYCAISGNTISDIGGIGIDMAPTLTGMTTDRTNHNVVSGNAVSNTGLAAHPVAAPVVAGIRTGVGAAEGDQVYHTISGNNLANTGGLLLQSSRNLISGNSFDSTFNLTGQVGQGDIYCTAGATGNTIQGNAGRRNLTGNAFSVDTSASTGNTISDHEPGTSLIVPNAQDQVTIRRKQVTLTDGATVAVDATIGTDFLLAAGGSRTISAPSHPAGGLQIAVEVLNNTGGAITTTWDPVFHVGSWVDPAAGKRRIVVFRFSWQGTLGSSFWAQVSLTPADF
jgi:hypothetical protein